jgi:peroxiredoxin
MHRAWERFGPVMGTKPRPPGVAVLAAVAVVVVVLVLTASAGPARPADGGTGTMAADTSEVAAAASLVGTRPPEWRPTLWLNSPPLRLADLRGKVVLVRWWTADCPFCAISAPALGKLDAAYRERGVVVVGMYHHKGQAPFDPATYRRTAKKLRFTFPLAFDPEWRTLHSWLRGTSTGFTSVTFLLDQTGVVRYVHPGGGIVEGDDGYARIRQTIEDLLRASP